MSFGNKGDDPASPRPAARRTGPAVELKTPPQKAGFDLRFLVLIAGVVVLAGGGAFAAPSVIGWTQQTFAGARPVRPIAEVVAHLSRDQAKAALADEAFADRAGAAFLATLRTSFPADHDRLLGKLADAALAGGDREALMKATGVWLADFVPAHVDAIGRSGAKGFDRTLDIADRALGLVKDVGGGDCNAMHLQSLARDPQTIATFSAYGSKGYALAMDASRMLVDLAAEGRNAPPPETAPRAEDEMALRSVMQSLSADPDVMRVMQASMTRGGGSAGQIDIDICGLGHRVIGRLKSLPSGAKARLWGFGFAQLSRMDLKRLSQYRSSPFGDLSAMR